MTSIEIQPFTNDGNLIAAKAKDFQARVDDALRQLGHKDHYFQGKKKYPVMPVCLQSGFAQLWYVEHYDGNHDLERQIVAILRPDLHPTQG